MPSKDKWSRMSEEAKDRSRAYGRKYYYDHCERRKEAARKWSKEHPEIVRARSRAYGRGKYSGLHIGGETRLGTCPICLCQDQKLLPDHDHGNGRMRDWICRVCNVQLGQFETREANGKHKKFREYLSRYL